MADSLGFKLSLDDKLFEIKIDNAERLLNRLSKRGVKASEGIKRLEGSFKGIGSTISSVITTVGMASFAFGTLKSTLFDTQKAILDSAGKLERLQVMLQGLATSTDKAKESMSDFNYIINQAKSAPFSIDAISDSFVKLKSSGIDPTKGSLNGLIDATARFGGDSELLKRATVAIQQMSGKGVISMEELRQQLGEAIPTAMQSMALGMNVSMGDLVKAVSSGTVRSKDAIEVMMNMLEVSYSGSANRMMNTYTGLLSQMETNASLLAKSIADAGYMDVIKDVMRDINRLLGSDAAMYYGKQFGEMAKTIVESAKEMFTWIMNNQSMLVDLGKALMYIAGAMVVVSFFKTVTGAILGFNRAITSTITNSGSFGKGLLSVSSRAGRMGSDLNLGTIAIGRMKHAWRALNTVMKANLIVLAITTIIEVLMALAWWYDKVNEKAKDAMETAKNTPELVTDEQFADLKEALEQQEKDLAEVERKLKFRQSLIQSALKQRELGKAGGYGYDRNVAKEKAYLEEKKKLEAEAAKLSDAIFNTEIARQKAAYEKKLSLQQEQVEKEQAVRQSDFRSRIEELNKQMQLEIVDAGANQEKKNEIIKRYGDAARELYKAELEHSQENTKKMIDLSKSNIDKLHEQLKAVKSKVGKELSDAQKTQIAQLENQIVAAEKSLNSYVQMYDSTADKLLNIAKMFAGKIVGINGELMESSKDTLASRLKTLEKNSIRNSASVRMDQGEKIKMIDGRYASSSQELQMNEDIIEALKAEKVNVDDLDKAYASLSSTQKASVDAALKNARMIGDASNTKKSASSLRSQESKAEKAKRELEKLSEVNKKVLDMGEQFEEKVGFGSTALVKYDQKIKDVINDLDKLSKSKPIEGALTQEQIDQATRQLNAIKAGQTEYRQSLQKDTADQLISKWAGFSDTVKINMTKSVAEQRAEFEKSYQEADKHFLKIREMYKDDKETKQYLDNEYQKFKAGKLEAMVRLTETATAKMAYDYQNVGNLIDENIKSVFDSLEDRLMDFIKTGEFSIKDFGDFIFEELQRTFIRSMVVSPMINGLGLGASGDTGQSLLGTLSQRFSSMLGGSSGGNKDPNAKATADLGKAATETTSAFENLQSQGIFATIAGYAKQLWATITGTAATETKASADLSATTTVGTFAGVMTTATTAVGTFIAALGASSASSSIGSIISMAGAVGGAVAGGASSAAPAAGAGSTGFETGSFAANMPAFANGGIMSSLGEIPLKAYAKGGIATSPQLALFGEGSHNEAYVPLPDGRRIPVNMNIKGDAGGGAGVFISINVENNGSDSSESSVQSSDSNWNGAAKKIKAIVLETMTEEKRPGGMLRE
ncbi:tape measure protein [Providencia sp. PROV236]|uniref:tape measure protein n=1 Tax=Providencia sp. PROV236 TaxID=2936798 RepID=UPI0034E2ED20